MKGRGIQFKNTLLTLFDLFPNAESSVIIEWCILVFAVGHIVSTLKQFCFMPVMFFSQNWNIYEVLNHIFYIIAYAFFIKAWNEAPAKVI